MLRVNSQTETDEKYELFVNSENYTKKRFVSTKCADEIVAYVKKLFSRNALSEDIM